MPAAFCLEHFASAVAAFPRQIDAPLPPAVAAPVRYLGLRLRENAPHGGGGGGVPVVLIFVCNMLVVGSGADFAAPPMSKIFAAGLLSSPQQSKNRDLHCKSSSRTVSRGIRAQDDGRCPSQGQRIGGSGYNAVTIQDENGYLYLESDFVLLGQKPTTEQ